MQLLDVTSSSDDDDGTNAYQPLVMRSTLSQFVRVPSPPHKKVTIDNSRCGTVLTSSENLKLIEEKRKANSVKRNQCLKSQSNLILVRWYPLKLTCFNYIIMFLL